MIEYTPTTLVVKHAVTFERERLGEPRPIKPEAFDRWLKQVEAEAWEEGFSEGVGEHPDYRTDNPYRQEQA